MAKKDVQKSIRMTNEVSKFVEGFEGTGFNEKFENLVFFCMKEEKNIKTRIKALEKQEDTINKRVDTKWKLLNELGEIQQKIVQVNNSVVGLYEKCKKAEVVAKGVQGALPTYDDAENVIQTSGSKSSPAKESGLQKKRKAV